MDALNNSLAGVQTGVAMDIPTLLNKLWENTSGLFVNFRGIGEVVVLTVMMVFSYFGYPLQPWMATILGLLPAIGAVYLTYKSSKIIVKYGLTIILIFLGIAMILALITGIQTP